MKVGCFSSVITLIVGLCLNSEIRCEELKMDEASLMIDNRNNSERSVLLLNSIICEECDLEEIVNVSPYSNGSVLIKSEYAYDLEIRSISSQGLLHCYLRSYKFAEHGRYLIEVKENSSEVCSVVQTSEEVASYWLPMIIGVIMWIVVLSLIEVFSYIWKKRSMKENIERIPLINRSSIESTDEPSVKRKRFQALDAVRGLALMLMIFVNYGGMFFFCKTMIFVSSGYLGGGYWFFRHAGQFICEYSSSFGK